MPDRTSDSAGGRVLEDVQFPFSTTSVNIPTCNSNGVIEPFSIETPQVLIPGHNPFATVVAPPPFDLTDEVWRDHCMKKTAHIPAGYTYFSQLVGHDLGNSAPIAEVPLQMTDALQATWDTNEGVTRYNLIENPLTLETVYGPGPRAAHLYDAKTKLFRIARGKVITTKLREFEGLPFRAIHDDRNRDTIILHRLCAAWMKFHNQVAQAISFKREGEDLATVASKNRRLPSLIYAEARNHVAAVWRHLIQNDLLPTLIDQSVETLEVKEHTLDDVTMLHGVFRAFHAMPRKEYAFENRSRKLRRLLLSESADLEDDVGKWPIDWPKMFDPDADGTKTGISASATPALGFSPHTHLILADAETAKKTGALLFGHPAIKPFIDALPEPHRSKLAPNRLAEAFNKEYQATLGVALTEKHFTNGLISFVLMIEAQLYGINGKFGPLGSLMLFDFLKDKIERIRLHTTPDLNLPMPDTILDFLIQAES